jgi:hypothetical protein
MSLPGTSVANYAHGTSVQSIAAAPQKTYMDVFTVGKQVGQK